MSRIVRRPPVEHRNVPPIRIEEPVELRQVAFNGARNLRVEVLRDFAECGRRDCSRVNLYR